MQILVDIDENLYTRLFDNGDEYVADMRRACVAIRKGIPLPKGHGRLIDADSYHTDIKNHYFDDATVIRCTEIGLNNAPTIIEADKEGDEV